MTITFLILFELSQESTIALVILHTARVRTVGTGFALFARPLTSCVIYIYRVKKRTCKSAVFLQKYIFVKKRHLGP